MGNQKHNPSAPYCVAAYVGLCGAMFSNAARAEGHWAQCGFADKGSMLESVVSIIVDIIGYWKSRNRSVLYEAIWALNAIHEGCSMDLRPIEVREVVKIAHAELEEMDEVKAYAEIQHFLTDC